MERFVRRVTTQTVVVPVYIYIYMIYIYMYQGERERESSYPPAFGPHPELTGLPGVQLAVGTHGTAGSRCWMLEAHHWHVVSGRQPRESSVGV